MTEIHLRECKLKLQGAQVKEKLRIRLQRSLVNTVGNMLYLKFLYAESAGVRIKEKHGLKREAINEFTGDVLVV